MTAPNEIHVVNPIVPNLLYSEIENEVRGSVKGVLDKKGTWSERLARTEFKLTVDVELWKSLALDVGLAGLAVAESEGGADASWREVAVVLEELGRRTAAVPFLGHAVTATALLNRIKATELLTRAASCDTVVVLAVPATTLPWSDNNGSATVQDGRVSASVRSVTDARIAEVLLVPVGDDLYAVNAAMVEVTPVLSLDMTRQLVDIEIDSVPADLLAVDVKDAIEYSLVLSAGLLASEQLGLAEEALQSTVDYLKQRRQFGRVLGSYQALKHRLADLWVEIAHARAVARYAAACAADESDDLPVAAALAHSLCSAVAVKAAEECVRLQGGIGFTWELPSSSMFGGIEHHRERLGVLVNMSGGTESG